MTMGVRPFNSDEPIAYFITWTSYGTWLTGDERGWRRRGEGGVQSPNELLVEMATSAMKETAFTLSANDRETVEKTIARHCEVRGWTLFAVNARSNHVHIVATAPGYDPKTVRDQLKAWCTRHLKKFHTVRARFWTEGGSCRWINQEVDLEAAITYVKDAQDQQTRRASE
ncbi:MAG: transposase [Aeoliella sp.]